MHIKLLSGAIVLTVLSCLAGCRERVETKLPLRDPFSKVNPFIGTGGIGFGVGAELPGALVPFGMVKLSPDTLAKAIVFSTIALATTFLMRTSGDLAIHILSAQEAETTMGTSG